MKTRVVLLVTGVIVVACLAVSAWGWTQIPDGTDIPIHWGFDGRPNGWAPKPVGLLLVPAMALGIGLLFAMLPYLDPRRGNQLRSTTARVWIVSAALVLLLGVHVIAVLAATGAKLDIGRFVVAGVGLLSIVIGNYLGKVRSNWFVGVRTPWTLSSERSWARTHRLAGYLFVGAGLLAILLCLVAPPVIFTAGLLAGMAAAGIVPVVYSYFAWRSDPDRRPFGG